MADDASHHSVKRVPARQTEAGTLGLSRGQVWGILLLVYTAIFVLIFSYDYLDDLSRERLGTFGVRFLEEGTGVYSAFLLLPLIFRAARFLPFRAQGLVATYGAARDWGGGVFLSPHQLDGAQEMADRSVDRHGQLRLWDHAISVSHGVFERPGGIHDNRCRVLFF